MTTQKLINIPIKNTLVALAILIAIFFILRIPQLMLLRIYNADCSGAVTCMKARAQQNHAMSTVLSDLILVSRILIELGVIYLAIQLVSKVAHRK